MNIKRNFVAILALAVATSFAQQTDNAAAKPAPAPAAQPAPAAKPAPVPAAKPAPAPAQAAKPAPAPAPAPAAQPAPAAKPAPAPTPAPAAQPAPAAKPAPAPTPAPAAQPAPAAKPAPAPAPAPAAQPAPAAKPAPAPAPAPAAQPAPAAKPAKSKAEAIEEAKEAAAAKKEAQNKSILKADYVDPEVFYGDIANGKKPRGKMTYEEYNKKRIATQDSLMALNYHHGVTLMGANTHDTRYGDLDDGFVWSGAMGLYYFYRHYFLNHIGLQGRFGMIYRYGRFDNDESAGTKTLSSGKKLDFTRNTEITYNNFALDLPLEFKVGGNIEPTTFLYVGFTFGLTKSIREEADVIQTLDVSSTDKGTANDLKYLTDHGYSTFPLEKTEIITEPFYMDDWETNGWVGVGIDGKYLSAEFQVLVASGSTKDNHRYYHLFHDTNPTWRIMVDFSMR